MKAMNTPRAEAPIMFETENDISKDRRVQLNALLNRRLASAVDLQMQMKQAHWNVKGPGFIGLHELFDKVAEVMALVRRGPFAGGKIGMSGTNWFQFPRSCSLSYLPLTASPLHLARS
jgi:Ferritin-like domain